MATTNFYVTPENGFPQLPNSTMLYISNNKEIYYNYNMHKHELVYIKVTPTTNLPLPPKNKKGKEKKKVHNTEIKRTQLHKIIGLSTRRHQT